MAKALAVKEKSTRCCIVGGGPAGMMAGYLLARAGVEVCVLEKHGDFLRDFRGDTVHPSTMQVMSELGILTEFLKRPHQEVTELGGQIGDEFMKIADFSRLDTKCRFLAFMPQWEFLDFLSQQARRFPTFNLMMNTEATAVLQDGDGRIVGVEAKNKDGNLKIMSDLVIAADGRHSALRQSGGFAVQEFGAPMDVLWLRMTRESTDPPQTLGRIAPGVILIMLNRQEYWQLGYVIQKGGLDALKQEGLESFRARLATLVPFMSNRVEEIRDWNDVRLLTVRVDRLNKWYRDGMLCIGDAAHAMSPIGGVGINLAIQDAVAAANILWQPLSDGHCTTSDLEKVQERRLYPTRMTQRLQIAAQKLVVSRTLKADKPIQVPWILRVLNATPALRKVPATVIGIGFRPEHVHCPDRSRVPVT